jgi:PAS domain S-box-containing protein
MRPDGSKNLPAVETGVVNILLVDDEVRNLDVLESILSSPGYRLVRAQSAQEALMALIDGEFAAIVLDIQMPGTNGLELAHLIKQRKRTQHIPIIFLTAYFQEDKDVIQGYDVGAVDYLTKPVDSKILKSKIAVFVELFQKNRELAAVNRAMEGEISQREKAEQSLRQANNDLEARVEERTAKLTQANDDLRLSNAAVLESEQRYSQLIRSLPAAVYTTDARGHVTLYNQAAAILWGREPEIGKDLWCGSYKIFRPDGTELPVDQCPMAITLKEGRAVRGQEIIIERPDGTRRNILPYPDPIRDAAGKIIGAVNMLLDITEMKRTEEVSSRLAAIVESSDDAIVSKDLNGIVTSWNRGAERLFGYKAEEIIGRPITILFPPERIDEERDILQRIRCGEHIEHYETVRQRKDGSLVEISLTISPIRKDNNKIIGASKIGRDITRQKQAERELDRAHKEVVAASRAKDDFLAALSHELRTPLNPVLLLASDSAENPQLPAEVRAQFATIRNNVELEARLIDDLLDITRITHGKLLLNMDWTDIHAVLKEAIATVRFELDEKQISLSLQLAEDQSVMKGDAVRLQQIFWNVLKNAVKFNTQGGEIKVETSIVEDSGKITIKIIDSGIGMAPEEITHIFNAFSQGGHIAGEGAHRFGGLGLGLTISRMLVELHSGVIFATSGGRDKGSTFVIELPLVQSDARHGISLTTHPLTRNGAQAGSKKKLGMRILLVEDHEPTRAALTNLLTGRDCKVFAAKSVAEAQALAKLETFDLVVSDIGLPDGNGYMLMSELREKFGLKGIALTGYGMEQDVARGQNAGFVAYLIKPVRVESLEKALCDASIVA